MGRQARAVKKVLALFLFLDALGGGAAVAEAQQARPSSVGIVLQGGPYYATIDGLRDGLRELGLEEGKHFVLDIRDVKGDLKALEGAARSLEREKANLIYAITTSAALAVKRATSDAPVVFCVGADPAVVSLVESFAKPGGRLTGVHFLSQDLTAKRLEILKEILPKLRRVVTFYNPSAPVAREGAKSGREAGRHLGIEFVERHVASVQELQAGLRALRAGEADAYFLVADGMVISQAQLIIDTARAKRLATMFHDRGIVAKGALASYGVSYYACGRQSAKHVQRILAGTNPKDLPVEGVDRLELVLNLRTAQELGLTIPRLVLLRADKIFQ